MTDFKKANAPRADRNGLALLAVALVFGGMAMVADLMWMAPHATSAPMVSSQSAAQNAQPASSTMYFPSQFTLNAKESDEPAAAPTF